MRGTVAKRLRQQARELTGKQKTTISRGPGAWRYLTGYRRIYQDLKHGRKPLRVGVSPIDELRNGGAA